MEDGYNEKEVYFGQYCKDCRFRNLPENEEPCETCLANPMRYASHKPLKFEKGVANGRTKVSKERQQGT